MIKFTSWVEIDDKELEDIMEELEKAKDTIYKCYSRLDEMGIVIKREEKDDAASGN